MSRSRAVAVSAFCVFHVVAILWWNVIKLPAPRPTGTRGHGIAAQWTSLQKSVRSNPAGKSFGKVVRSYVRFAGLWQQWFLFAPDPPQYGPKLRVFGVRQTTRGYVLDPEPIFEVTTDELDDHRLMLASPPCGFETGNAPAALYVRGAWTRFVVRERVKATGYVGARLVCTVWPVPVPGDDHGTFVGPGEDVVLWEGPL